MRNHLVITYAKFNIFDPWYEHVRVTRIIYVIFPENFLYVLNRWSLSCWSGNFRDSSHEINKLMFFVTNRLKREISSPNFSRRYFVGTNIFVGDISWIQYFFFANILWVQFFFSRLISWFKYFQLFAAWERVNENRNTLVHLRPGILSKNRF